MTARSRLVLFGVAVLLFLGMGWLGLRSGAQELAHAGTPGQQAQAIAQLGYGFLAIACVLTAIWRRSWGPATQWGWAVSVTLAAGLAPIVWGGAGILIGVLAGAAAAGVAVLMISLLRVGAAGLSSVDRGTIP